MSQPTVTIIVAPRERFQFARESLDSLYENTFVPFKLVYVDNNSPDKLRQHLEFQSLLRSFQVVRSGDLSVSQPSPQLRTTVCHYSLCGLCQTMMLFSPQAGLRN